jgi:hypothetical protein
MPFPQPDTYTPKERGASIEGRYGRCCAEVAHEAADCEALEPNAANWPRS